MSESERSHAVARETLRILIAQGSYARSPEDLPYGDVADRIMAAGWRPHSPNVGS